MHLCISAYMSTPTYTQMRIYARTYICVHISYMYMYMYLQAYIRINDSTQSADDSQRFSIGKRDPHPELLQSRSGATSSRLLLLHLFPPSRFLLTYGARLLLL